MRARIFGSRSSYLMLYDFFLKTRKNSLTLISDRPITPTFVGKNHLCSEGHHTGWAGRN